LMFLKEIGLSFSVLDVYLYTFAMSVILASQNELGSVPFFSSLWKSLRSVDINSLKMW
jgi:hypothetical protein